MKHVLTTQIEDDPFYISERFSYGQNLVNLSRNFASNISRIRQDLIIGSFDLSMILRNNSYSCSVEGKG